MKAIGITCGIGSMLIGARNAGFEVISNVEYRRYYHHRDREGRNTFEMNFPGAIFKKSLDDCTPEEIERMMHADIALGHPECGNYSVMNQNVSLRSDPGDIPLFIDIVNRLKPRFFVQDNLPRSLIGCPIQYWQEKLPDYNLFPEWISNYNYGNIQKSRNRFFMIGALKSENFVFVPGEFENTSTLAEVLSDCEGLPNQNLHVESGKCGKNRLNASSRKYGEETDQVWEDGTWENFRGYFERQPDGHVMLYVTKDGVIRRRIGTSKGHWNGYSHLLDGSSLATHPRRNLPFTIRERARIQGCPDDFVFYGENLPFNHEKNTALIKQTGKFMPVQFCEYVSRQIASHIRGDNQSSEPTRVLYQNPLITEAKQWYCKNVGYSYPSAVCRACWKYGQCKLK